MRPSLLLVVVPAGLAWILAIAAPTVGALAPRGGSTPEIAEIVGPASAGALLATTIGYAVAVTIGALGLGWAPGRWLGGRRSRAGFAAAAALLLLPLCLPAYVIFYTWWQAWPADSALYGWAVAHDRVGLLRRLTLVAGLVCWSWPLVAWCVAAGRPFVPAARTELLAIDGAGWRSRLADALRTDAGGLALGGLVVFLLAFTNTTCFDLAQVYTIGNELRARDALGAAPAAVLAAALPAVLVAALGSAVVWRTVARRPAAPALRTHRAGRTAGGVTAVTWLVAVAAPLAILVAGVAHAGRVQTFLDLYGRALGRAVATAAGVGALAALVAAGLAGLWLSRSRGLRSLGHVQALGWLLAALVPGTVVALGLEAAYNRDLAGIDLAGAIYGRSGVLVLGLLARAGFVGALLGLWIAREPRALADLRRLDGAPGLGTLVQTLGPRLRAGVGAAFVLGAVVALGEVPVTARVQPPGETALTTSLLAAMHYQRPDTVIFASAALVAAGLLAALAAALAFGVLAWRPRALSLVVLVVCAGFGAGCEPPGANGPEPLRTTLAFGGPGLGPGRFSYPRCIAADPDRGVVYVIDKTARVQRFAADGTLETWWRMPRKDNGKPTGMSVAPDGRVAVADTHYHRVIVYDADGNELQRFGRYGEGPGEFIYPTDVAFGPDGSFYVSEYGGNDRVQVFGPDGTYRFGFGTFGSDSGAYNRPQALAFSADRRELYVADACNHRIVVTDPEGTVLRTFGGPGSGPGMMHYPYGLEVLADGSLLVAEFGNNRLQRLSASGASLGRFGRHGTGDGDLRYPWGVAVAGDRTFVLDSGNNRVLVVRTPG